MKKICDFFNNLSGKRIINAIFFGIGGAVISKGLLMIFNMIAARILNETLYGIYSIINNTVQTFIVFASAGLGVTLTRSVALYRDKDKEMTGIVIKTLLIFNILLSIIVSILMFVFSNYLSNILNPNYDISLYLKITSLTIFFTSLVLVLQSILQGFENFKHIALGQVLSNILMLVVGVVLTYFYGVIGTIITLLILQVLLLFCFTFVIRKILKCRNIHLKFKVNDVVKDSIKNVAIPAFLSSVFVLPVIWFTNFKFTKYNGYEQFAAFSVCLQWFNILNYLPQQLGQVKPIYTQMYDDGKFFELKSLIKKMMSFSICFSALLALVLGIGSKILLNLYGDFYSMYYISFIIMLIASVFFAVQSQFGSIFQAIGKVWICFILNVVWAVSFVISFFTTYKYGVIGYTLTYFISYAIYSLISVIYFNVIINKEKGG